MERLTLGGFLLRLAATSLLVVLSYNPSGYSYLHWVAAALPKVEPLQAVAGLVLLGAWAFCAHATWRSLGAFGVLLAIRVSWSLLERRVTGQVVVDEGEHP